MNIQKKLNDYKKGLVTWDINYHIEDVFAVAFVKLIKPSFEFEFSEDLCCETNFEDPKFEDILMLQYDWNDFETLIDDYGSELMSKEEINIFKIHLLKRDNTKLFSAFNYINPLWNETCLDDSFNLAVDLAKTMINNEIRKAKSLVVANEIVTKSLENSDGNIVFLETICPYSFVLSNSSAKFVVYKNLATGYNVEPIPTVYMKNTPKISIPKELYLKEFEGFENYSKKAQDVISKRFLNGPLHVETKEEAFEICKELCANFLKKD